MNKCGDEQGSCELYDADTFRHIYFGLAVLIKIVGLMFMSLCLKYSLARDRVEQLAVDDKSLGK